jgi:hypothetical protein
VIRGRDVDGWLLVAFRYADGEPSPAELRVFDGDDSDLFGALDVRRRVQSAAPTIGITRPQSPALADHSTPIQGPLAFDHRPRPVIGGIGRVPKADE